MIFSQKPIDQLWYFILIRPFPLAIGFRSKNKTHNNIFSHEIHKCSHNAISLKVLQRRYFLLNTNYLTIFLKNLEKPTMITHEIFRQCHHIPWISPSILTLSLFIFSLKLICNEIVYNKAKNQRSIMGHSFPTIQNIRLTTLQIHTHNLERNTFSSFHLTTVILRPTKTTFL